MTAHVLFVCTGNICRSPLAEHLARRRWAGQDIIVSSAGTHGLPGLHATTTMVAAGTELGVDLSRHRSRDITAVHQPDLALCMEEHQVAAVQARFPTMNRDRIRLLDTAGIIDPYGATLSRYRITALQIKTAIDALDIEEWIRPPPDDR
ncbi:MAG: hypothetical protein M5U23_00225 [Acidimicrobiia bacterium]|nr:hypothetical protein [Acidimicrobiia bacterium]